jgi:signal transduction histidine kinase/CheY-like chemotaxis protein
VPRLDSVVAWLRLSMILATLLPIAFYAFAAVYSYRRTFDDASLKLEGVVRVTQEHASKVFQTNEVAMGRAIDALGEGGDEAIRAREGELHRRLAAMSEGIDHLQDIRVWNREGRLLASSTDYPAAASTSIGARTLFRQHLDAADGNADPQPKFGRVNGEDALQFSQRRSRSDGSFDGIVTLGINPHYFTDFYKQFVQTEPGLVLSLVREDGLALARWPPPDAGAGTARRTPADPTRGQRPPSRSEGGGDPDDTRLKTVRALPGYPLRIEAAVARDAVLARWYRNLLVLAAFTFPTALALVLVSSVALRRAAREREAVEQLRAESDRRLQVEESLRQSQKLEAIGRMTGGVAHDVNNLLMVIDSNLHLIQRLEPALAQSSHLAAIAKTTKTGERLMRQLLAFSRRQALNPEVMRLQDSIGSLIELVRTTLGGRIRIDVQVDPDTAPIEVDMAELELAMLNLAVNARDAMPGPGVLTIRARNLPQEELQELSGRFVELSVSDTGKGIDPKDLPYVLEPFFTTKGADEGTGLGLSQVYGLCAQAGGTVRVQSKPGAGTRIRMIFRASDKPPATAMESLPLVPQLSARVLLVEDHQDVADATTLLLESLGCTVRHATTGEAAQAMLASEPAMFDILLADIAMPGKISGIDLASWAREAQSNLAVVLMTGYTAELRRAKELSHVVLQKPVSPHTLAATLARAWHNVNQVAPRG